jgi:Cytochrome c3
VVVLARSLHGWLTTPVKVTPAFCTILFLCVPVAAIAKPATSAPPSNVNNTCLMCHAAADAKGAGGKSIAVDGAKFAASVHGEMKLNCTDCHADVSPEKLPHGEKLKPVDCANCHGKAAKEYAATGHGTARKGGNSVAAACADCHGKHDILRAKNPASRTNHINLEATCSRCHGSDTVVAQGKLPGGNIGRTFHDSIHGRALAGAARMSAPECTDCHGTHNIRPKSDPESSVSRRRSPDTCGSCHQPVLAAFTTGQHGKLRQEGNAAAPVCIDCHSAHGIQRRDIPKFQMAVINQCGTCHADYLSTYRDTFHGQVTALGYSQMATCASCHGAHEVLPESNPASRISPQNRLKTCQTCHAGASANFANYDPHANRHDRARNPLYYFAAKFMELLLYGVFALFGVHTVFWFYRELREKLIRRRAGGTGQERH